MTDDSEQPGVTSTGLAESAPDSVADRRPPEFSADPVPRLGKIVLFDEEAGLGVVRGDDGSELGFHCTAIAGGSRRIPEGARVTFVPAPAHLGLLEATGVTPVTMSSESPA